MLQYIRSADLGACTTTTTLISSILIETTGSSHDGNATPGFSGVHKKAHTSITRRQAFGALTKT